MKIRLQLLMAAVVLLSLLLTANAFAVTATLLATGPSATDRTPLAPTTAITVSDMNLANPIGWGHDANNDLGPTGQIFDLVNLGANAPGAATVSFKIVRVPTAIFPTDYIAIRWTPSATAGRYDIFVDRPTAGPITGTAQNQQTVAAQTTDAVPQPTLPPIHPVLSSDPAMYKYAVDYWPTQTLNVLLQPDIRHAGILRVRLQQSQAGNASFNLLDKYYQPSAAGVSDITQGVTWLNTLSSAKVLIQSFGELRNAATVPLGVVSIVDKMNVPDPLYDRGSLAAVTPPARMFWNETGTVRAAEGVTINNSGDRNWLTSNYTLKVKNLANGVANPLAVPGDVATKFTLSPNDVKTPTSNINTGGSNTVAFILTAPGPKNATPASPNPVDTPTARHETSFQLYRNYNPGTLRAAKNKDFEFPTVAAAQIRTTIDVTRFDDVGLTDNFRQHVELLAKAGITTGTQSWDPILRTPPQYTPNGIVTRRQMAAFLGRAMRIGFGSDPTTQPTTATNRYYNGAAGTGWAFFSPVRPTAPGFVQEFTDVAPTDPLAEWIYAISPANWAAGLPFAFVELPAPNYGTSKPLPADYVTTDPVTRGTTPTTYSPDTNVTRIQMAAFLRRAFRVTRQHPTTPTFTDVVPDDGVLPVNANEFNLELYESVEGIASPVLQPYPITTGTTATTYTPNAEVSRLQMAIFLVRASVQPNPQPDTSSIIAR